MKIKMREGIEGCHAVTTDWLQSRGVHSTEMPYFIFLSKWSPLSAYKKHSLTVLMDVQTGHVRSMSSLIESCGVNKVNIVKQSQRMDT